MFERAILAAESLSAGTAIAIAATLVFVIGLIDYYTGLDVRILFIYLVPMAVIAWRLPMGAVFLGAIACTIVGNLANRHPAGGGPPIHVWVWNAFSMFAACAVVGIVLHTLRTQIDALRMLATRDPLTNLLNRRAFMAALEAEVHRGNRHGRALTIIYLDVDDLKIINDTHGHHTGDEAIKMIARVLSERLRNTDFVARLGGDEFAALLPETDAEGAKVLGASLMENFRRGAHALGLEVRSSIGAATFDPPPNDAEAVLRMSDTLMYEVKKLGKGALRAQTYYQSDTPPPKRSTKSGVVRTSY